MDALLALTTESTAAEIFDALMEAGAVADSDNGELYPLGKVNGALMACLFADVDELAMSVELRANTTPFGPFAAMKFLGEMADRPTTVNGELCAPLGAVVGLCASALVYDLTDAERPLFGGA